MWTNRTIHTSLRTTQAELLSIDVVPNFSFLLQTSINVIQNFLYFTWYCFIVRNSKISLDVCPRFSVSSLFGLRAGCEAASICSLLCLNDLTHNIFGNGAPISSRPGCCSLWKIRVTITAGNFPTRAQLNQVKYPGKFSGATLQFSTKRASPRGFYLSPTDFTNSGVYPPFLTRHKYRTGTASWFLPAYFCYRSLLCSKQARRKNPAL